MPAVSVLIPARNAAATLDEALASIQRQSYEDWEALLVDDGSTDATPEVVADWCRRDSRFRLLAAGTPRGLVPALNRALAEARAPVIARMDADDVSRSERFARQLRRLSRGDVAAVGCRVRYFPPELVRPGALRYQEWLNSLCTPAEHERDLFVECPIAHPSLMASTAWIRRVGGYQDRHWPEDYDLLLRLWLHGARLAKVPEELLWWRESADRTSRRNPEYSPAAFLRCKVHYLDRAGLLARPLLIFGAGPVGKALARELARHGATPAAFVDVDPRKVGQRPQGIPVISQAQAEARRDEAFGLVALGQPGARLAARDLLTRAGWREGADFRCLA